MGDGDKEVAQQPTKPIKRYIPRPRKLHLHGLFVKPATKVGISATGAYFKVIEFLLRDLPLPPAKELLIGKKPAQAIDPNHEKNQKLRNEIKRSHEILATAKTVFPFTLFPDRITVDRRVVTINRKNFFFSGEISSFRIEDILNVSCALGPFFGSITIASRVMSTEDRFTIYFFWRKDAIYLKHILQGYVIAHHDKIDCQHLEKHELIETLEELGHDAEA